MAITKKKWESLNDKAQWDVKVALRGPDSNYGEVLKWFTTSVIRGQVKGVFRVGGTINTDLKLIITPLGAYDKHTPHRVAFDLAKAYGWNYNHFIEHVRLAAEWLEIPDLAIPYEVWHTTMQMHSATKAGAEILRALEGNSYYHTGSGYGELIGMLKKHCAAGIPF